MLIETTTSAGLAAATVLGLGTVLERRAADWGLLDRGSGHKRHGRAVPVGGPAVVLGSLVGLAPAWATAPALGLGLVGMLGVAGVGLLDDRQPLSPWVKLGGQALAALVGVLGAFVGGVSALSAPFSVLGAVGVLGVGGLVGATNAFNLIDGLDGLACGQAVALAGVLGAVAVATASPLLGHAAGAAFGAAVGFLAFNRPPARLFLGDSGSYGLGFLLAAATLAAPMAMGGAELAGLGALAVAWGYPLADMLVAIGRRLGAGRSPLAPDREHLHHRLARHVGPESRAVAWLYGVMAALALSALGLWLALSAAAGT